MKRIISALILSQFCLAAAAQETVSLLIRDVLEREVIVHKTDGLLGAVLVHQSGANAASWNEVAKQLQDKGITSVAVESTSSEDVLGAVEYLLDLGKSEITLVGSSIGGGSVMQAAQKLKDTPNIKVALLGTADGDLSDLPETQKLFIVTEGDFFSKRSFDAFRKASAPKTFYVLKGQEHGQDMFDGPDATLVFETLEQFVLR